MKKLWIVKCLLLAFVFSGKAQITTDEIPFGLRVEYKTDTHQVLTIDKSAFPDMREIEAEDKENDEKGGLLRFAFSVQVNSSMEGIRFLANLA